MSEVCWAVSRQDTGGRSFIYAVFAHEEHAHELIKFKSKAEPGNYYVASPVVFYPGLAGK